MTTHRGFTLVEMLIGLMILSIVGTAMVGTLIAATRLFELGERQRASADEAMTTFSIMDSDIGSAIPRAQGGHFHAELTPNGNCYIGWTITNPNPADVLNDEHEFVLWGIDDNNNLRRSIVDSHNVVSLDPSNTSNNAYKIINTKEDSSGSLWQTATVTADCWYLGAFLAAEADVTNDGLIDEIAPLPADDWWQEMSNVMATSTGPSEPSVSGSGNAYTTNTADNFAYPRAMRIVLMIDAGRVQAEGQVVQDDDTKLRVAGLGQLPVGKGRFLRVGNELIGYYQYGSNVVSVNTHADNHGPLGADNTGRGIYRTTKTVHPRGTTVQAGQVYTITRMLPY